jgi:hypothetical protein
MKRIWGASVIVFTLTACAIIQTDSFRMDVGCRTERDKNGAITRMKCDRQLPLKFEFRW